MAKARGLQEEVGGAELRMESWRLHQQLAEVVGKRDMWREKEKETPQVRCGVGEGREGSGGRSEEGGWRIERRGSERRRGGERREGGEEGEERRDVERRGIGWEV